MLYHCNDSRSLPHYRARVVFFLSFGQTLAHLTLPLSHETCLYELVSNEPRGFLAFTWTLISIQYACSFLQCLDLPFKVRIFAMPFSVSFPNPLHLWSALLFGYSLCLVVIASSHRSLYFYFSEYKSISMHAWVANCGESCRVPLTLLKLEAFSNKAASRMLMT
jgi:hypothetical protein